MKVLVIPEDPVLDRYILTPIVERLFSDLGQKARVTVLENPRLRGVDQALDPNRIMEIIRRHEGMIDLFLLMVDRDCDRKGNTQHARHLENVHPGQLLACLAVEEVEVWMLALHRQRLMATWADIRGECDPKERYVEPFLRAQGWDRQLAGGRPRAMRDLGKGWSGLLAACPELVDLKKRISAWLAARPT
jgi:hypothetical protein